MVALPEQKPDDTEPREVNRIDLHTAYETLARAYLRRYLADLRARKGDRPGEPETTTKKDRAYPPDRACQEERSSEQATIPAT